MTLEYVIANRTNGANPFKIFESLSKLDADSLAYAIKRMPYDQFLKSAYWFAVSSVAKSRAGMRCQICNSFKKLSVHHRTYDTHGKEHLNMMDLVVLDENCHGLFHGHLEVTIVPPIAKSGHRERSRGLPHPLILPHGPIDQEVPESDPIILTRELVDRCRANGSFTNATLNAFGITRSTMTSGWTQRLIGTSLAREKYRDALNGKFIYRMKLS